MNQTDIYNLARDCGITHKPVPVAVCKMANIEFGTMDAATAEYEATIALARRAFELGRQQGLAEADAAALEANPPKPAMVAKTMIVMDDLEIDAAIGAALGTDWGRQAKWLRLVGRPVARAILAALDQRRIKPMRLKQPKVKA
jgi:hypothetical protein